MSFTWRSILDLQWKIGDGKHVRVWFDPWLPRPYTYFPITPRNLFHDVHLWDLMDSAHEGWNFDLLDYLFYPRDAKLIKPIPTKRSHIDDSQIWHFNKLCIFSIKSTYLPCFQTGLKPSQNMEEHSNKFVRNWLFIWEGGTSRLLRIQMVNLMIVWRCGKLQFDFHNVVTVKPSAPLCSRWFTPCRGKSRSANMVAHCLARSDCPDQKGLDPPITLFETLRTDTHDVLRNFMISL
ncbi:hypothetical protein Sango_0023400 [Sesamum angolense]|uniref:Reverse transcriptase zinc-binding domain-containing protein n=1 Tax=Sesamum angolense TaxID=2727404 RepID=A0AAE2C584_9LAMI|nr:hypothetical protein Sango_0023400 [Sesamum angolense]